MKVSEIMSQDVRLVRPDQTIREAAQIMSDIDAGAIPVAEEDRLIGMLTDRDIAIRAVARDLPPDTKVREVMSENVKYCFDDEDVDKIVENMAEIQIRRLPVVNRQKRLVGIVSLGDIATTSGPEEAGVALSGISEPGGQHSQSATPPVSST